jgi:hypothetical protein
MVFLNKSRSVDVHLKSSYPSGRAGYSGGSRPALSGPKLAMTQRTISTRFGCAQSQQLHTGHRRQAPHDRRVFRGRKSNGPRGRPLCGLSTTQVELGDQGAYGGRS